MQATRLKGEITPNRRLVVRVPKSMKPGAVEVILVRSPKGKKRSTRRAAGHPAFGIWAKRSDIRSSAAFAARLRRGLESRKDGNGRN